MNGFKDVKYDSTLLRNVFDGEDAESLHKKSIKILNDLPYFEAAFSAWPSIQEGERTKKWNTK